MAISLEYLYDYVRKYYRKEELPFDQHLIVLIYFIGNSGTT